MSSIAGQFWSQTFVKSTGVPYQGVRIFHYITGTTTNLDVFTDAPMTTAAAQPVVGDNNGRVSFYGSGSYRLQVKSSVADGDLILYDYDGVELWHHTATLRSEDRGTSNPAITAAHRGRLFATVDGGGDILGLKIVKTASTFLDLVTLPQLSQMIEFNKGANLASSTAVTLGTDGNFFDITGTTNIESFSTKQAGAVIWTRFTGSGLTLIHNATSFILPGATNYRTQLNEVCVWLSLGSGNWLWLDSTHKRAVLTEDARTTTVAVPVSVGAITTGTPAAGIGVGMRFDAESADEAPSEFGQVQFVGTAVGAGAETTVCELLLRTGGAALTARYRFRSDFAGKAIFDHLASADRTYTFPNVSGTVVTTGDSGSVAQAMIAKPAVGTPELKTATGSASVVQSAGGWTVAVTMNDYTFAFRTRPMVGSITLSSTGSGVPPDTVPAWLFTGTDGDNSTNIFVRWRYVTASDDPTVWVAYDPVTGDLKATWCSDDPTPNDEAGVRVVGMTSEKFKANALTGLAIAQQHLQEADARIVAKGLNPNHRLYRALQVLSNDDAPSGWLLANCKIQLPARRLVLK